MFHSAQSILLEIAPESGIVRRKTEQMGNICLSLSRARDGHALGSPSSLITLEAERCEMLLKRSRIDIDLWTTCPL